MRTYSKKIVEHINSVAKTVKGKKVLSCSEAFKLAEQTDVNLADIGKICNKYNIRIISCQLACF